MNLRAVFRLALALGGFSVALVASAQSEKTAGVAGAPHWPLSYRPTRAETYKKISDRELRLDLFLPADFKSTDCRAVVIAFHGGGWNVGNPNAMYAYTDWAANHGMVGISVQYRLFKPKSEITVFECVKDARSAVRYVRKHAAELGIDPQRVVALGSSAGGHLAVGAALFDGIDEATDDLSVSPRPDALVLVTAVLDTSPSSDGYGQGKIGERWREISPKHQVRPGMPPTLLFHGTADQTVPFSGAQGFQDAMVAAGNKSKLIVGPNQLHVYVMLSRENFITAMAQTETFLISNGFMKALPSW